MKAIQFWLLLFLLSITFNSSAQSYNEDKTTIANFLKRMYFSTPFEGAKVLESAEGNYFISIISLEKARYPSQSIMMRVAQVKAQSQTNTFFNGSTISTDFIIKTTEDKYNGAKDSKSMVETIETIRENSIGFVKAMELLINFDIEDGKRMVFVYYKELELKQ